MIASCLLQFFENSVDQKKTDLMKLTSSLFKYVKSGFSACAKCPEDLHCQATELKLETTLPHHHIQLKDFLISRVLREETFRVFTLEATDLLYC